MTEPASWKVELVDQLSKELDNSAVAAIVSIKGIRNEQLQQIRRNLRSDLKMRVLRKRLLLKAFEKSKKPNINVLKDVMQGQIALITTELNPAKLNRMLEATKQKAPARGGEIAPEDIIVEANRDTGFPPGPMISEFQKVGLPTAIEKGKIIIKKETVLVKEGEVIPKDKAKIMEKLEIKPITVGLDVLGAYGDGLLYSKDVLSITLEEIVGNIVNAFSSAKGVALETMYLIPEIIPQLLVKAKLQSEVLALESGYMDESNVQIFILKAIREANAISRKLGGEEVTSEVKEEEPKAKEEEKSEEDVEGDISEGLGALFG